MRTTVTLDEDVVARLRAVARERGIPFKVALNDALRAGLSTAPGRQRPYRVPELRLRMRPEVNLDKALRLAAELEDREVLRKMQLGK